MGVKSCALLLLLSLLLSSRMSIAAECDAGLVSVYATGSAAVSYGAPNATLCAEFCLPEAILQFARGSVPGTCDSQEYTTLEEEAKIVQIPGSANPLTVNVYSKDDETNNTAVPPAVVTGPGDSTPSLFAGPCVDCEEYVALSAEDKLDRVWSKIVEYEYDELPTNWLHKRTNPTVSEMIANFPDKSRVNMIFDRVSDERPPNFPRMLHEYGSIAKVAWEPNKDSGFTGFYSEGNDFGIIRITFCIPVNGARSGIRVLLAFAVKFFRDGIHSSNIPTCEAPDRNYRGRDPVGFSVFKHPVHTTAIISSPIDSFFTIGQNATGTLSIADNSWYSKNGTRVENPVAPLIVHFFPNDELNTKEVYEEDFRLELIDVPINSTLYTAYTAVDDDGHPTICTCYSTEDGDIPCLSKDSLTANCNLVELGSLTTRSEFIHSDYGDNAILFKHYRACQEDRKYCEYNQAIPDSTFTKSANLNGTCISRRRVAEYDGGCPFFNNGNGLELVDTQDYCSTPDEGNLEKMCPFANALHPAFSGHGVSYPLTPDDHLRRCSVAASLEVTTEFPLVAIGCCRVVNEYFDDSTKAGVLPTLCNMADCKGEFQGVFPDVDLATECDAVGPVEECKFDLRAGPSIIPMNLGFVTLDCCAAIRTHSDSSSPVNSSEAALDIICAEEVGCVDAYDSLYQQGQAFSNPSSTESLADVCLKGAPAENEANESDATPVFNTTSGVLCSGRSLSAIVKAVLFVVFYAIARP